MSTTSPPLPPTRRLLAAAGAALALTLGAGPAAFAAPGDNGDVKVHDSTTPVDSQNDDPKVCRFYLDAFNFDTVQLVSWTISQQPPTGTAQVLAGTIVLANGTGATQTYSLPDGHYKLDWTFVGESGSAKHKVFDVSCATSSPSPSGSPSHSSPGGSPSGGPHGGVGTGGGGTSGSDAAEVVGGVALVVGAGGIALRSMRRRPGRNAES
ncbi:hypothetical protein [Streptomyces sp. NRRL S-350]|uniref:hypothetical protein n=1 Tax=Streptomyces sp. NRRL S-350 TaxID=1463902 RepID=UPI001F2767CF|nr:hypothetical protein [Streptomyces sp. NRRL S-350]